MNNIKIIPQTHQNNLIHLKEKIYPTRFHFPDGLFGFENDKDFLIVKHPITDVFIILQSLNKGENSFILTDGNFFFEELLLGETRRSPDHETILHIVTINSLNNSKKKIDANSFGDQEMLSLNLLGPLCFDHINKTGRQLISSDERLSTKHFFKKSALKNAHLQSKSITARFFNHSNRTSSHFTVGEKLTN